MRFGKSWEGRFTMSTLARIAEYQRHIGNDVSIGDHFVITGQQVGLMGGPLYTFSKAISCILLARKLQATPLFWAATEDHDVHEVNSCTVLNTQGNLKKYCLFLPEGHFVEDLPLTEDHQRLIRQFQNEWNVPEWEFSRRYAETMIRLLVQAFKGTGLAFIEPRILRSDAGPFFIKELRSSSPLSQPGPIQSHPLDTHLFYKNNKGKRIKIRKAEAVNYLNMAPDCLSPDVAARPVFQSSLIPTVAYIAGPTELTYHSQLKAIFKNHKIEMPTLYPRLSLTLLPTKPHTKHYLNNLLHPRNRPQERVLNWWMFGVSVQELLTRLKWEPGASYLLTI